MYLYSYMVLLLCLFSDMPWILCFLILFASLLMVSAHNQENQFPNITFRVFSDFILNTFASKISLAKCSFNSVFSTWKSRIIKSACQTKISWSTWRKKISSIFLVKNLWKKGCGRIGKWSKDIFSTERISRQPMGEGPHNKTWQINWSTGSITNGKLIKKLKVTSKKEITPVHFICPISMACTTAKCEPYHLSLSTRMRDIPKVSLIKGSMIFKSV